MNYITIKEFLPSATYIYSDITDEDLHNVFGNIYITEVNNIRYLGTNTPIDELSDKELIAPPVEEVPVEEVPVEEVPVATE